MTNFSDTQNNNFDAELQAAVIRAVLFFDLFDYPLTAYEIWRYLDRPASLAAVIKVLEQGIPGLESNLGFYCRSGRTKLILERMKRYNVSREKFRLARRSINLLKHLPGIKFIGIANLMGAHNWRLGSDIDLLVITTPGKIWTSRFFAAGLMKFLKRRPQGADKADKICLSFYASASALDFAKLRRQPFDPYFSFWLADLLPVYDTGLYHQLIQANPWLSQELPNWQPFSVPVKKNISLESRKPGLSERLFRRWQLAIMPLALKHPQADSGVVVNDQVLKLYVNDKRPEIAQRFIKAYEDFRARN